LLAGGATQTTVTATTNAVTTIVANAVINAGNRADITSVANTVVRTFTEGNTGTSLTELFTNLVNGNFSNIGMPSILASGGAGSGITVNNKAQTILDPNASVNATNQVNITADGDTSVRPADGQEFSAAMTTRGATLANAFAITDVFIDSDALIDIRQGAKVSSLNVNIDADNQISALAAARGNALVDIEGAHGSAFTRLNIGTAGNYSEAKISFATGTDIIGTDSLRIDATNSQKDGNLRSRAQGRGESNLFVGIATARSEGTAYVQSIVESASGSAMRSGDLSVNAESNFGLDRHAETISSTLVTKTLTVIKEVARTVEEKICKWMPWPLDKLCEVVTKTVISLVEVLEDIVVAAASYPSQGGLGVVLNGNGTYKDTINLNGDLYNIGSSDQSLKVNADGSIDATSTIGTTQDANNIYVDDIVSSAKMSMTFSANRGQIIGNAVMRVNKNIENLTVENSPAKPGLRQNQRAGL
ncbi:MAG: hypothetical protein HC929_06685, partial [Leptolyngbyaceae cyanobacterium SM2_5_2]|nr:hypothetical protein [Leptolyngbyaceae cyanobacterium SM2_5_2]